MSKPRDPCPSLEFLTLCAARRKILAIDESLRSRGNAEIQQFLHQLLSFLSSYALFGGNVENKRLRNKPSLFLYASRQVPEIRSQKKEAGPEVRRHVTHVIYSNANQVNVIYNRNSKKEK